VCSIQIVVVVVVVPAVCVVTCIYCCQYEDTSYTMVIFLCMSQWCDNDNHHLFQHVKRLLKWRDGADGNKYRSIFISFTPVTDTVSLCTCNYGNYV